MLHWGSNKIHVGNVSVFPTFLALTFITCGVGAAVRDQGLQEAP